MVRWVKIVGNQYFGFWVLGLVLFALQEIPYMLMPLFHLETNPIMNMTETSAALDMCEKILGSLCIALGVERQRKAVLHTGCGYPVCQLFWLDAVLHRSSEHFCDDAFYCNHATTVLCSHRSLAAKHAVSCDWVRIPGSALLSCTGKSAENVTITFTDLYVRSMK